MGALLVLASETTTTTSGELYSDARDRRARDRDLKRRDNALLSPLLFVPPSSSRWRFYSRSHFLPRGRARARNHYIQISRATIPHKSFARAANYFHLSRSLTPTEAGPRLFLAFLSRLHLLLPLLLLLLFLPLPRIGDCASARK